MSEFPAQCVRPVWIASYPRSGNTFLRIILERVFSLPSYSVYYSEGGKHRDASAEALQDAPRLPADWKSRVTDSATAPTVMIKTHDLPTDSGPAIFIARDGRAAIHSYYHYHKKFAFEQPSLTEVIAGICQFGSWSDHYRGWNPKNRPGTLFVLYDELVMAPEKTISRLAEFLKRAPGKTDLPEFQQLQQQLPAFFRRGQNADYLSEWTPDQVALFNQLHGEAMRDLGFPLSTSDRDAADLIPELAAAARRLHSEYLAQLGNVVLIEERKQQEKQELERQLRKAAAETEAMWQSFMKSGWTKMGVSLGALKPPAKPGA